MNLLKRASLRLFEVFHFIKYATPNVFASQILLSPKAKEWLEQMRVNGIVKIEEEKFAELADYLDSRYFSKLESQGGGNLDAKDLGPDLFALDINNEAYKKWGIEISCNISFKEPVLGLLLLDSDLTATLYNYLRRQPYYRNQPALQKTSHKGEDHQGYGKHHVDNLHQISFMLLISEQTEKDTHMEYALGSNRRPILRQGIYITPKEAREQAKNYPTFKCIGKKGTLFVFDTSGVHRPYLLPGSPRKMLHLNVTTGHHMEARREDLKNWPQLAMNPPHVQKMFSKLRQPSA